VRRRADRRLAFLLLAPSVVALGAVSLYPVAWVGWLSLRRQVPVFGIDAFVGLAHFRFLAGDPGFWNAVRVTAVFTTASVALELALGLAVAVGLARQRRLRSVALGLLLLPWCLPGVVTARMFEWIYHPAAGLANRILGGAGVNWLGDPSVALGALVAADVWRTLPFVALLCYARLLTIPPEVHEAAAVDGAGRLASFRAVTLPLLLPVLLVALLFRTLDAIRAFDLMFVLTAGGPARTTETLTLLAYRYLFQTLQFGLGSAVAVVVFALVAAVAWLYLRALEPRERPA
jgi:multiple sugar transport system permease protein